MELKLINF